MAEYVSPEWVDVPPNTTPPPGAPDIRASVMQPLTDAVADHGGRIATIEEGGGSGTLDPDLVALAALDSAQAGVIGSDGAGWLRKTYAQLKTALGLTKADVGLGNVSNLAPADLPLSSAATAALAVKADLVDGKVPQAQIPSVALVDYLGAVGSQSAMLALDGQRGDWCTRTDLGTDWQLVAEPSTTLGSWREHVYPASPVQSVNGRTAAVTGLAEETVGGASVVRVDPTDAAVGMVPAVSAVDGGGAATGFSLLAAAILDGVPKVAKANGDGRAGLLDWQNDDATGYLLHLRTGPNTGGDAAAIGIGTDYGAGSGLLVSHKNSGSGLRFIQNPGAGAGVYMSGMATNPVMWADIFAGSGGVSLNVKTGQGFADGVTTAGSTTLTSATAAFTAGDVGRAIAQVTSRGSGDPLGSIPANATIVAVVNSTTVTLSAAAPTSGTGIRFRVYGREPSDLQNVLRVFDTDGTTVLGVINRSQLDWRAGSVARAAIKARGKAGQTAGIVEVVDSANTILSRIGPNGHYMTRKTSAPADSELVSGEMAFWLDSTNGAAKLMVKAKEAGGTVRTAAVALA